MAFTSSILTQYGMLIVLGGYMALQLGLCYIASRFIRSEADFLLAGRSLGPILMTFSLFATWFGAETIMGSSGAIAAEGLSGSRADPFGYTLCLLLMGLLLAGILRERRYVTVGDFFADHYGRRNEVLASLVMIPTSIIWAAAQIQAFALILATVSPLSFSTALSFSVMAVIAYTWLGGLLGDVLSDLIQGLLLIIGLVVVLALVILKAGGWPQAMTLIQPEQLTLLVPDETWLTQLNVWMIPILGSLVSPEALSRTLAAKTPRVAKYSCLVGGGLYFLVGLMPVLIALIGTHLVSSVSHVDAFLPTLVHTLLPPWLGILFLGALVSAILSTIDSTLLGIAGLASHNILVHGFKSPPSEKTKVLMARLVVLVAGVIAYLIATGGQSIYSLVETASSFGSAGFLVCLLGGLYLPGVSPWGITIILIAGVIFTALYDYVLALNVGFLCSVASCAALYLLFWLKGTIKYPAL